MSDSIETIRKESTSGKLVIGTRRAMAMLRRGELGKVYLASNVSAKMRAQAEELGKMSSTPVEQLAVPASELGVACRKQFSISILGEKK